MILYKINICQATPKARHYTMHLDQSFNYTACGKPPVLGGKTIIFMLYEHTNVLDSGVYIIGVDPDGVFKAGVGWGGAGRLQRYINVLLSWLRACMHET